MFLFLNKLLCLINYFVVLSILFGLIFLNVILCLYDSFCFNFIGIVFVLFNMFGSCFIVVLIFVGILIILFFKFNWLFFGSFLSCINVSFGEISFFFRWVIFNCFGIMGNFILFVVLYVGILFCWMVSKYVL